MIPKMKVQLDLGKEYLNIEKKSDLKFRFFEYCSSEFNGFILNCGYSEL